MPRISTLGTLLAALSTAAVVSAPDAAAWTPEDARLAACDFAREVGVYDYTALEGYFQRVLDRSTGEFAQEFSVSAHTLKDAMQQHQVRAWIGPVECGSAGGDLLTQRVLIDLVQYRTNITAPAPQRQYITMTATLENHWGRWLVSSLDSPML